MKTAVTIQSAFIMPLLWLAAVGLATAQRVGDVAPERVIDVVPAAVSDVPFGPALPVTEGLMLHLAADAIDGLDDGDPVGQWDDLSGHDRHALGASFASLRLPLYVVDYQGKPAVRFHGNTDGAYFDLGTDLAVTSVFFVVQMDSDAPSLACVVTTRLNNYPWSIRRSGTGPEWRVASDANDWINTENRLYVNGNAAAGGVFPNYVDRHLFYAIKGGTTTKTLRYIGASEFGNARWFKGTVSEVVFYDRILSAAEREAVEQYLIEKWMDW